MKATFALFATYLAVIVAGLIGFTAAGLARQADDESAADVIDQFAAALESGDGEAACELLTPSAQDDIESSRRKPCERGVLELRAILEPHGEAAEVNRAERSAIVTTKGGSAYFLGETPDGWRLGAAGCERKAGEPFACEVEG